MIEALMYGFTPRAMIEKFSRPPPENRLSSWRKLFWPMTPSSASRSMPGTGHVGEHPDDDEHPQDEEDAAADVRGAEGIDQRFEHGLLGRPGVALTGSAVGGLGRPRWRLGRPSVVGLGLVGLAGLARPSSVATVGRLGLAGASSWTKPPGGLDLLARRGREGVGGDEDLDVDVAMARAP